MKTTISPIKISTIKHCLVGPYKQAPTNPDIEKIFNTYGNKLQQAISDSFKQQKFGEGTFNNVYELKGSDEYLLKIDKRFDTPAGQKTEKALIPYAQNPNHIVGKIGYFFILKKQPGINVTNKNFTQDLASLPQKSYNEFMKHIKQLNEKGFRHDVTGFNTLIDTQHNKIRTIDSHENADFDEAEVTTFRALLRPFFNQRNSDDGTFSTILKKSIKALVNVPQVENEQSCFSYFLKFLTNTKGNKIQQYFSPESKVIRLYGKIAKLKKGLADKSTSEIKQSQQWKPLKKNLRKLNRLLDKTDFKLRD